MQCKHNFKSPLKVSCSKPYLIEYPNIIRANLEIIFLPEIKIWSIAGCMAALVWPNGMNGRRLSEYFLLVRIQLETMFKTKTPVSEITCGNCKWIEGDKNLWKLNHWLYIVCAWVGYCRYSRQLLIGPLLDYFMSQKIITSLMVTNRQRTKVYTVKRYLARSSTVRGFNLFFAFFVRKLSLKNEIENKISMFFRGCGL